MRPYFKVLPMKEMENMQYYTSPQTRGVGDSFGWVGFSEQR